VTTLRRLLKDYLRCLCFERIIVVCYRRVYAPQFPPFRLWGLVHFLEEGALLLNCIELLIIGEEQIEGGIPIGRGWQEIRVPLVDQESAPS
jgi:hypothetical protein